MKKTWFILTVTLIAIATSVPAFAANVEYTHDEVRLPLTTETTAVTASRVNTTLDEVRAMLNKDSDVVVWPSHQGMELNDAHTTK